MCEQEGRTVIVEVIVVVELKVLLGPISPPAVADLPPVHGSLEPPAMTVIVEVLVVIELKVLLGPISPPAVADLPPVHGSLEPPAMTLTTTHAMRMSVEDRIIPKDSNPKECILTKQGRTRNEEERARTKFRGKEWNWDEGEDIWMFQTPSPHLGGGTNIISMILVESFPPIVSAGFSSRR
jgi:hypothetical protein